jgi:hypothetical protein
MNRFFNSSKIIGLLFVSAFVLSACEDEPGPAVCVIEVVDDKGSPVEGATVYVNADNSSAIIDDQNKVGDLRSEEVTGSDGKTRHSFTEPGKTKEFALEAVLEVKVWKAFMRGDTIPDTLVGRGSVHIYPDKVTNETITVR